MSIVYHDLINFFIKRYNLKSYVELGTRDLNSTFNNVIAEEKIGVDITPIPGCFCMSTDEFFDTVGKNKKSDVFFIDASHFHLNVEKDYKNCLERLNEGGVIVMDDIAVLRSQGDEEWLLDEHWCGTAYKTFIEIANDPNVISHHLEGTRFGFVRRGKQVPHNIRGEINYEFMQHHHKEIFKPVSWDGLVEALDYEDKTGEAWIK